MRGLNILSALFLFALFYWVVTRLILGGAVKGIVNQRKRERYWDKELKKGLYVVKKNKENKCESVCEPSDSGAGGSTNESQGSVEDKKA